MIRKQLLKKVGLWSLSLAFRFLFKTIDKDNDGKLSKKEIEEFVGDIVVRAQRYAKK